jgi:hypothetical protein
MTVFMYELLDLALKEEVKINELLLCCIEQGITNWYIYKSKVICGEGK